MDIALAEGLTAIWKHSKVHKDLESEDAESAVQDMTKMYDKLTSLTIRELSEEAAALALSQNISIYDSFYIAATRKMNATLYTADQKLHNSTKKIIVSKLLQP